MYTIVIRSKNSVVRDVGEASPAKNALVKEAFEARKPGEDVCIRCQGLLFKVERAE